MKHILPFLLLFAICGAFSVSEAAPAKKEEPEILYLVNGHKAPGKEERKQPQTSEKPVKISEKQETARQKTEPVKEDRKNQPVQQPPREEKQKPKEEKRKAKVGDELVIPEDAVKTGNLDFLEGCWQGTRPEYYSKRTIRECFCFGKNGRGGTRRVIDPKGGRTCTGDTKARLDGRGALHVTSQGARCDDGERWGAAQMTCRGNGQKTPCSWVFTDASGGHQKYEIPFVRVSSCGR